MKIPVELLSEIFLHLENAYPRYEEEHHRVYWDKAFFLDMRAVCRKWRDTVDQLPQLWAQIALGYGVRMTEHALALSKNAALDIRVADGMRWGEAHVLFLRHLSRIRTINISVDSWDAFERLPALLSANPAPRLSTFFLFPLLDFEWHRKIVLPADIFRGTPPEDLRAINLLDCSIILPSPLFAPTIIDLRLSRCDVWEDLDSLLDGLQSMPALKVFQWCMGLNALSNTRSATRLPDTMYSSPNREPVLMPCMERLNLTCPMSCAADLVSHLILPPSCQVDLADDYTLSGVPAHDHEARVDLLLSAERALSRHLSRIFPSDLNPGYDTILVQQHPDAESGRGAFRIQGRMAKETHPRCSMAFCIADLRDGSIDVETMVFLLHGLLGWPSMNAATTSFQTNYDLFAAPVLWAAVFERLHHIRQLCVDNTGECDVSSAIPGLIHALNINTGVVPVLSHVHLQYTSFPSIQQEQLVTISKLRFAHGCPPLVLCVDDCEDLDPEDFERIVYSLGGDSIFLSESPACCE